MSEKEYLKELGQRVVAARKKMGLTQEQLAERAGVSNKIVQKLETGANATRSDNLVCVLRVLEEDVNYILFGDMRLDVPGGMCAEYNQKISKLTTDQLLLFCTVLDTFFKALESKSPFDDTEN